MVVSDERYAPDRVLVAGDVHGSMHWFGQLVEVARMEGCQVILQLGDFGYWEHQMSGRVYLDFVTDALADADLTCVWIDGNHENHTMLRAKYVAHNDRLAKVRPHLFYAPRGCRWEWHGVTFLALGGAYSVDKRWRTAGQSWWEEETITEADVIRSIEGGPVDVLVSHDAPWGADGVMGAATVACKDDFPESVANRQRLRAVLDATTPHLNVHGHYHHRNTTGINGTRIEGYARDDMGLDAFGVIDLRFFRSAHPAEPTP